MHNALAFLPTGAPNQHDAKPPVGIPTNCEFGIGDDSNMLYVTADKSLFRVRVNAKGLTRHSANNAGGLSLRRETCRSLLT